MAAFTVLALLLIADARAAMAAALQPDRVSFTLIRPAPEQFEVLTVISFHNETGATVPEVALPLPHGYEGVTVAMPARTPEQLHVSGQVALDTVPLAAGETRQYVYRTSVPLPAGGTRFDVTLPWAVSGAVVLVDEAALRTLPDPVWHPAGTVEVEGRQLTAFQLDTAAAGTAIGVAIGPGEGLTATGPVARPTRWERLQANFADVPLTYVGLGLALSVALWATRNWWRQGQSAARLAAERQRLVERIASLDLQAAEADGPPSGYAAERERLLAELVQVARRLGEDGNE